MSYLSQASILLQLLLEHLDEVQVRVGDDWPNFSEHLLDLLGRLIQAEGKWEIIHVSEAIIQTWIESPARDVFWRFWLERPDISGEVVNLQELQTYLSHYFSDEELCTLCQELGVDYDDLPGEDVNVKTWELLRHLQCLDRVSYLILVGERLRPEIPWYASLSYPQPSHEALRGPIRSGYREGIRELAHAVADRLMDRDVHAGARGVPTPRYFNTWLLQPDGRSAVPSTQPLVHGHSYFLNVHIHTRREGLDMEAPSFPDELLEPVWDEQQALELTVVAASRDFDVEPRLQTLSLPREGPSESVRFEVRPHLSSGRALLSVGLFYHGHLLQSKQVEATIVPSPAAAPPSSLRPAQFARTTFTSVLLLDPHDLAELPERVLTIEVERDPRDGSIDFRFLDRTQALAHYDTRLQPGALGQAVAGVRRQLEQAIVGEERDGVSIPGYVWRLEGDDDMLQLWLPRLARAGRYLYHALLPQSQGVPGDEDRGERLQAALQPDTVIQIDPVVGVVTLPWALLYERPLKSSASRTRVCEDFTACHPSREDCPHAQDPYVVCPYAFWGYRYAIEHIPCWVSGDFPYPLVRRIANERPLYLNLNVWRDFSLWDEHKHKLETAGEVAVLLAEEVPQLEQVWQTYQDCLDVIYFYSHGGVDEVLEQPYLQLSDERIDSLFLKDSRLFWEHYPLVFLNGCATGDYGPQSYTSLIEDFRAAGASGVVGTECAVPEMFAEAYAAALFPRLFRGEPLGQAMLAVRRAFLTQKKNPLGLVYTLYAAHEVALARPVAASTRGGIP